MEEADYLGRNKHGNLIGRSTDAERSCGRQVDVDSVDGPSDVIQALIGVAQARVCGISEVAHARTYT